MAKPKGFNMAEYMNQRLTRSEIDEIKNRLKADIDLGEWMEYLGIERDPNTNNRFFCPLPGEKHRDGKNGDFSIGRRDDGTQYGKCWHNDVEDRSFDHLDIYAIQNGYSTVSEMDGTAFCHMLIKLAHFAGNLRLILKLNAHQRSFDCDCLNEMPKPRGPEVSTIHGPQEEGATNRGPRYFTADEIMHFKSLKGYKFEREHLYKTSEGNIYKRVIYSKRDENGEKMKDVAFFASVSGRWVLGRHYEATLYNIAALRDEQVFYVEGEKDVDTVTRELKLPAITAGSAGDFKRDRFSPLFAGKHVVIIPDHDARGVESADNIAGCLLPVCRSVKIVKLPRLTKEKEDVTDWVKKYGGTRDELLKLAAEAAKVGTEEQSVKVDADENSVDDETMEDLLIPDKEFPNNALSPALSEVAIEVARAFNIDLAISATLLLGIASGICGNAIGAQIVGSTWKSKSFIWPCIIAESGGGKSASLNHYLEPIRELQGILCASFARDEKKYQESLKKLNKDSSEEMEKPLERHLYVDDATIEKIAPILQADSRGLIVAVDELAGFFGSLGEYKKGPSADMARYQTLWNGKALKVDRKSSPSVFTRRSGAALVAGVQPACAHVVFNKAIIASGFAQRFLYVFEKERKKKIFYSPKNLHHWDELVQRLYTVRLGLSLSEDTYIDLSPAAFELWKNYFEDIQPHRCRYLRGYRSFIAKYDEYALRIAALLHLINGHELTAKLSAGTMEQSIQICDFYLAQLKQCFRLYAGQRKCSLDKMQIDLIMAIADSRRAGKLKANGMILLADIIDKFRSSMPPELAAKEKMPQAKIVSGKLKELGFKIKKDRAGANLILDDALLTNFIKIIRTFTTSL